MVNVFRDRPPLVSGPCYSAVVHTASPYIIYVNAHVHRNRVRRFFISNIYLFRYFRSLRSGVRSNMKYSPAYPLAVTRAPRSAGRGACFRVGAVPARTGRGTTGGGRTDNEPMKAGNNGGKRPVLGHNGFSGPTGITRTGTDKGAHRRRKHAYKTSVDVTRCNASACSVRFRILRQRK